VRYVDDSKATNIGAARRSLEALGGNLIWIAGGRHKGGALDELAESAKARVKHALLIGEAAREFEAALAPHIATEVAGDLNSAIARAAAIACPGDVVLLAPACASFDQFKSFEARGNAFRTAVQALDAAPTDSKKERT
jgi:UDP-N-acetylmuramoylalanine--D-glutamate ligase